MEFNKSKKKTEAPENSLLKKFNKPLIKITVIMLLFLLSFSTLLLISGCKKKSAPETTSAASVSDTTAAESTAPAKTSESPASTKDSKETAAETLKETAAETATESTEAIPSDVSDLVDKANGYYSSGEYGLAKSTYRKAMLAINDSELSDDAKQDLQDSIQGNYDKSKNIVDTVLIHYGNAMQLQYETRYEEAKAELEAALAIYPKYEEAQEAYETLKAMMGLD